MTCLDPSCSVHQLVLVHGRERAREMVAPSQRLLVDIAAEVMADETQKIGFSYSGFCLTSLPHKKLPDDMTWEKRASCNIVGRAGSHESKGKDVNLRCPVWCASPNDLLYLQTQAIRTGSREVALGRSMRDWMERMGLAVGGETARGLREQAARISACTLKFFGKTNSTKVGHEARLCRLGSDSRFQKAIKVAYGKTA